MWQLRPEAGGLVKGLARVLGWSQLGTFGGLFNFNGLLKVVQTLLRFGGFGNTIWQILPKLAKRDRLHR
ncbi:MAG: hypothetical protein CFE33_04830 [Pseudorhodobacter sp. PARRP1]|nr:MAG: hypothetical protein CFE33_04830 [Pseudorhodobacter sp. PARRP1]